MAKKAAAKKPAKKTAKKAAAKKTPKKQAAPPPREALLVGSKVKAALRQFEVNVGEGTVEALNEMMYWYIEQAAKRAQSNNRKTVRPYDVIVG